MRTHPVVFGSIAVVASFAWQACGARTDSDYLRAAADAGAGSPAGSGGGAGSAGAAGAAGTGGSQPDAGPGGGGAGGASGAGAIGGGGTGGGPGGAAGSGGGTAGGAGAGGTDPAGLIPCGKATCDPAAQFCCATTAGQTCVALGGACDKGLEVDCVNQEGCPGAFCCADFNGQQYTGVHCAAACDPNAQVEWCNPKDANPCHFGGNCRPSRVVPGVSVCQ